MEDDSLDSVALSDVVVPLPVVNWPAVVSADDPTRPATIGRLHELRAKHHVSAGVPVPLRRTDHARLAGSATYFSVLSVLAVKSRHQDWPEAEAALVEAAAELEERFASQLTEFLGDRPLAALPEAGFFDELAVATAEHVSAWTEGTRTLLAAAEVAEIIGDRVALYGSSPRGDVAVDLPRAMADSQSLDEGDLVWLFSAVAENAAVIDLLPALSVRLPQAGLKLRELSAFVAARTGEPGSDGLTDAERQLYADQFYAGAGSKLTSAQYEQVQADARQLVTRKLRPAG